GRAGDDFLRAVAVRIGGHLGVRAGSRGIQARHAVVYPILAELAAAPVVRGDRQPRVVAAALDDAGRAASGCAVVRVADEGDAAVEAIDAIAVAVAPSRHGATRNQVVDRRELLAGRSFEHAHVLRAAQDVAVAVAVNFAVVVGCGGALAQVAAGAVLRAGRGLDRDFRLAVTVEIGHGHLRIVLAGAD